MSKKSKGEMPDQESKRRKDEQRELFDRAARTRARGAREADEQRIWQQNQQHNTL